MTVAELIARLSSFPQHLPVVYEYDTGHSYPEILCAHMTANKYQDGKHSVCLFEDAAPRLHPSGAVSLVEIKRST